MVKKKSLIDILVCPRCKKSLTYKKEAVFCRFCNLEYSIIHQIPVMIDARKFETSKENILKYYNLEASKYNISHGSDLYGTEYNIKNNYLKVFKKYIKPKSNILEFGAGTGRFSKILKKMANNFYITDLSLEMLLQNRDSSLGSVCADTEALPFPDNFFDLCIGVAAFAYLPNKVKGIKEIRRVLKPGGRLLIIDMNRKSFIFKLTKLYYFRHRKFNYPSHINESNLVFLKKLFLKNGFTLDESGIFSWVPHALTKAVAFFFIILDRIFPHLPILKNQAMRLYITGHKKS